jgi:hypothetical protein
MQGQQWHKQTGGAAAVHCCCAARDGAAQQQSSCRNSPNNGYRACIISACRSSTWTSCTAQRTSADPPAAGHRLS